MGRRQAITGVNSSRQAATAARSIAGATSDGSASQSAARPAACAATKATTARPDAATTSQSERPSLGRSKEVRGAEEKPRASIDSASWIEDSALVSTTGTTTSAQERGPRGFHPRKRCASLTSANEPMIEGTRKSDAAMVSAFETPKASASSVYGPPSAGTASGSAKRTVRPRCAETKLRSTSTITIAAAPSKRRRSRARPTAATSTVNAAARTSALYAGLVVNSATKMHAPDQAATALPCKDAYPFGSGGGAVDWADVER